MTPVPAPGAPLAIAYLTDVEGLWSKFESFADSSSGVSLDPGGRLILAPDTLFVFGGDAIDRGPQGRRIVAALLDARERYPDRVVLLAGNRDINKMRLRRELAGFPPQRTPEELRRGARSELLRWIFSNTMGAALAFDCRQRELRDHGEPESGEAVVDSFLADLTPDGELSRYLAACQLAYRSGGNLFVHGSVTPENLGRIPGLEHPISGVEPWIDALNHWYREQVGAYLAEEYGRSGEPAWAPLVAYQAPLPGTKLNQSSVVYARPTDDAGNPSLPPEALVEALKREGVSRVIVGHSPVGDCPALLRAEGFELLIADNSYSPVESGCRVVIRGERVESDGPTRFGAGERVRVALSLGEPSPIGRRVPESGCLVKGQLSSGDYLLFRSLPGFRVEHRVLSEREAREQAIEPAWPPPRLKTRVRAKGEGVCQRVRVNACAPRLGVLLLLLAAACNRSSPPAARREANLSSNASTSKAPMTTSFNARGCAFTASLAADKTSFLQGEPVFLTFEVTTPCAPGFSILDGGDYRNRFGRAESFPISATSAAGVVVPAIELGAQFGGLTGPRPVSQEKAFRKRLLVAHWVDFPAPGRYRLGVGKSLEIVDKNSFEDPDKATVSVLLSTEVEVLPSTPEKMGAIIDQLGARFSSKDDEVLREASQSLERIPDPRVVRHFVQLFHTQGTSWAFTAIQGVSPFATDEALALLKEAAAQESFRNMAAQSLASSPHPQAWDALWALRDDKDSSVRLTVLHRLARRSEPDVEARIKAFESDSAPLVQQEARRYLAERKAKKP